ncbi:hypothetical protein BLJAPNOD_04673 [Ensifer sp. M14]|nr:hypothetical protein BLJAPNOD_04673 [Ensifer sp. M14]
MTTFEADLNSHNGSLLNEELLSIANATRQISDRLRTIR